jgi:hypothetical protein
MPLASNTFPGSCGYQARQGIVHFGRAGPGRVPVPASAATVIEYGLIAALITP